MLHYYDSHTKLSNEFLLIRTHQDLLHMSPPLYYASYFLNKQH